MDTVLLGIVGIVAVVGAATVVFTREVMRLSIGLGAFLLAVAAFFAYYGFGLLALAQLFVYVGGVLVLVLFAIMLVHRSVPGSPSLTSRHDPVAAVAAVGIGAFLVASLRQLVGPLKLSGDAGVDALGDVLLSVRLVHFELAGLLLLVALVAVVVIGGGEDR